MTEFNNDKYKKLLFSIRMAHIHSLITDGEYNRAFQKLGKMIIKENELSLKEAQAYIDSIWWSGLEEKE